MELWFVCCELWVWIYAAICDFSLLIEIFSAFFCGYLQFCCCVCSHYTAIDWSTVLRTNALLSTPWFSSPRWHEQSLYRELGETLIYECLLRVHYTSHNNLAAVCRSWEAMVKNPQFYQDRKNRGFSQQLICLNECRRLENTPLPMRLQSEFVITVYDHQQGSWETLPHLPHFPGAHHGIPRYCCCVCENNATLKSWE